MYRPTRWLMAPTRRSKGWRHELGGVTTRHFAKTLYGKKVDVQLVGGDSGMSHGSENSAKVSNNLLKRLLDSRALRSLGGVGEWLHAVRFAEWRNIAYVFYPCLWGLGYGCSQVLVLEAADMVVLNMPLLPFHLVAQFLFAAWNVQCAALLYEEALHRYVDKLPPRNGMSKWALGSAITTHGVLAMLLMMNMHPLVPQIAFATLPLAAAYPLVWRKLKAKTKPTMFARQVHRGIICNVGVALGYCSVVGRFEPWVIVPVWCAGVMWTMVVDALETLIRDDATTNIGYLPLLIREPKAFMAILLPNIFALFSYAAYATGQSVVFLVVSGVTVFHFAAAIDNLNLGDSWSMSNAVTRFTRFGMYIALALVISNACWCIALCSMADRPVGTDLREPAARPMTDTTLGKILTLNSVPAERFVIDGEVGFIERLAKPALVHKHILQQQRVARGPTVGEEGGPTVEDDDLHMPAYMRREHLVENLGRLFRGCIPTERMAVYEKWWYNFSDHYTLVSKLW
jgi:hypothetical protein